MGSKGILRVGVGVGPFKIGKVQIRVGFGNVKILRGSLKNENKCDLLELMKVESVVCLYGNK